uniref:Uncharacterized protein n=1 Tax=Timema tahoe TaxID=61484 RepID=A0A7R9FNA3_9NEOP|nr:unnamed protein product [Timema tahoe]
MVIKSALLRRSSLDPDRRRFSLGTSTPHRASDASLDPHHAAMLFRDSRGLSGCHGMISEQNLSTFTKCCQSSPVLSPGLRGRYAYISLSCRFSG